MNNKERLELTYKTTFNTPDGKEIIKDMENFILKSSPFFAEDIATDALLREGARHLLCYIHAQINNN